MLGYQGSSNYIVLTNSGVTVSNNVIFDEDHACHYPTPHAEGEAEGAPAEVGDSDSRHDMHEATVNAEAGNNDNETILDTIVVADPNQRSNRRIRHPFPLNPNAMLAYSFLGSIPHTIGPSEPPSYRHAKGDPDWPKWLEAMQSEHSGPRKSRYRNKSHKSTIFGPSVACTLRKWNWVRKNAVWVRR
jgi:hypothetical protein